jgi:hypothetical protein
VYWGKKRIAGTDYDLSHLDPFLLDVTPKIEAARTYVVRVSFGCHTFTRDLRAADKPDLHFRHEREVRCFCFDLHKHSIELPDMIRYAAGGRVYFNAGGNFLVVESVSDENAPYVAYFNVEKAKKTEGCDAAMFVTSAHLKPALPKKLPAVTFATLIDHTVQSKTLNRPVPRRIVIIKRK